MVFGMENPVSQNLIEFYNMSEHIDNGDPINVIYLDFSKTLDTVPHKRLMKKVNGHGILGKAAMWIEK